MLLTQAIIRLMEAALNFATEAIKSATPEQKMAMWGRHEKRMDFFEKLLGRNNDEQK